jgi:DNA modification methylase
MLIFTQDSARRLLSVQYFRISRRLLFRKMRKPKTNTRHRSDVKEPARLATERYLRKLEVQLLAVSGLKLYSRNPRSHPAKQIRKIADSIHQFGFVIPVLVDSHRGVMAGHGRIEAAKLLGMHRVPAICVDQMTEAQKRAFIIADNKLAENASWNQEFLRLELKDISELDCEFDLTITGLETAEIDSLLELEELSGSSDEADDVPQLDVSTSAVTREGDLWLLDGHRLLCDDATKADSFRSLLNGKQAQMVFIDPPYNVPINGHVSGLGKVKHREFAMASGEMSEAKFIAFLGTILGYLSDHSVDGSIHFICMDWRHSFELQSAARPIYSEFKNLCVWTKDNGGMGSLYRSKHELVFVFKNGSCAHINNVELGRYGRNRTNVWDYAGVNSFRDGRLEELAMHPTVKPVALVADAILDCSKRSGIVLDCFGGSGTTLIAAEKTGRRSCVMELDSAYVDVTIRRFQKLTGKRAIHAEAQRTFAEIERERAGDTSSPDGHAADEEGEVDAN